MMATFDALKAAAAQNLNLIITHEPTYWSHQDRLAQLQDDLHTLQRKEKQASKELEDALGRLAAATSGKEAAEVPSAEIP